MSDEAFSSPDIILSQALPDAVRRAVQSYQNFSQRLSPEDAKEFAGFHNACKAALGHLSALIKLDALHSKSSPSSSDDLEDLLRQTRDVLLSTEIHDDD